MKTPSSKDPQAQAETKHTPGPWRFDTEAEPFCEDHIDTPVFEVWSEASDFWVAFVQDNNRGDVPLIASAPEMLAALKQAETHLAELVEAFREGRISSSDGKNGIRSNHNHDAFLTVQKAIAKAEKQP